MADANVALRKRNFTAHNGYFYMFDEDQDNLLQKTDDGTTAFSYPLDTLLTQEIVSTEFDGMYFWSLEDGPTADEVTIRRWKIDNYICKLQQTISLKDTGVHNYESEAFTAEHYHTALSSNVSVSGTALYLNKYSDHYSMNFTSDNGDNVFLQLGPNSNGNYERVEVNATISGGVTLVSGTNYAYTAGDEVNYYTHIWLFNESDGTDSSTGALYKIDGYNGAYLAKYAGGEYKSVKASTFYNVNSFTVYGDVDTLCYVKNTNLLFVNLLNIDTPIKNYGSMAMDNIESDEATVIIIYDITMDDQNIYRLQTKTATESWANYNYQLSSFDSFVTSISLSAYPGMIAANTVSSADIIAIVKDQFLQSIASRLVYFTEDDAVGYITSSPISTNSDGKAQTIYKSGDTAGVVTITATVEQT